jgi:hypothetical protein
MAIFIIIIIVIVFIFLAFSNDKNKMLEKVHSNGGLQEKYKHLIFFFVNRSGFKIYSINRSTIIMGKKEPAVIMELMLTQSFNKVLINWNSKSTVSAVNLRWEFPDIMDQQSMIDKVMIDVVTKQQESINQKVAKAMRDFNDNSDDYF